MNRVLSARQVWGMPIVLGALSLAGLVVALVSDGSGDWLSALALAVPALVSVRGFRRREKRSYAAPTAPERKKVRPVGPRRF